MPDRILFITGRLAESAIRRVLAQIEADAGLDCDVKVLGISVAALMHTKWVSRKLALDQEYDRVILPGWCQGDVDDLSEQFGMPFELGPKDLFDLPDYLHGKKRPSADLSRYDIEILAEINHAPLLDDQKILEMASHYRESGADVIDVGCIPGESWSRVSDVIRRLVDDGHRVSIDSFNRAEVEAAVEAGAELVLSCNQSNVEWLCQLDVEVVAIPEPPFRIEHLEQTIAQLENTGQPFRIDPIIEPIGFGFAASLERYFAARRRWPDLDIMMGIGNVTELTEVDTAGVNMLLAGICQELRINSVLTTEVINWASSSVKEFDIARRQARYSITEKSLPKHIDSRLVMLRDSAQRELGEQGLNEIADQLTDPNYRIFAERGELHVMNRDGYWRGTDAFELFTRIQATAGHRLDEPHAFYLGYELCKAATALTLGKAYIQDQTLDWGFLQERGRDGQLHSD